METRAETSDRGMTVNQSRGRRHPEETHPYRDPFHRDRDRIIHSTAFRRLQYKTQVFIIHEGDYYRTRLTHTQEVAQIARTIGRALGLNETLIEGIALAHDLGHTPFGHSGEDALNQRMKEAGEGGFRHNQQSLRVVETLENQYPSFRGLNLTWELRESIIKHGYPDNPDVPDTYEPDLPPLLEEQVVDIADSIAYTNHDLDDGLKSGILHREELRDITFWNEAVRAIQEEHGDLDGELMRSQVVRYLINQMVTDLIHTTEKTLASRSIETVEDVRDESDQIVRFSPALKERKQELERFLHERMYCNHKVLRMQERARRIVRSLFDEFMREPRLLPDEYREWARKEGRARGIADYIAGMTDRFAIDAYEEVLGPLP